MRILSLAPSNTQILFALGLGEAIVGVTDYCLYPPEARLKPKVRGWVSIPLDDILRLKPDWVVTSTVCQEVLQEKLRAAGIQLLHLDPRDLAGVEESFLQIGRASGKTQEAQELLRQFQEEWGRLKAQNLKEARRPRIYCEEWHQPPAVSGNWVPELMAGVGADYFPLAPGQLSRPVTAEELQAFDPEIVILSICGRGLESDPHQWGQRPGFEKVAAVQGRRVVTLDDSLLNCPGPRLLQGARLVQQLVQAFQRGTWPVQSSFLRNLDPSGI